MNIQSKINYYVGASYYQLENAAGAKYKNIYNYIKNSKIDVNPNTLLIGSIYTCIAVDGKFSEKEWNFVRSFIGGSDYDTAFNTINDFYCDVAQDTCRDLVKALPSGVREDFIELCIIVMCVDGKVDSYEASFLRSII